MTRESTIAHAVPAPSSLAGGEVRDMSGETVMGMRVAAYRHPASCPSDLDKAEWLAFFNGSPPNTYCEHWSTPGEHRTDVERLFTEADVRTILAALSPEAPAREGVDSFETVEARAEAWSDRAEIQRMVETTTGVFAKWSSPEILSRFRQQFMAVIQQAFIEGYDAALSPEAPAPAVLVRDRFGTILDHLTTAPEGWELRRVTEAPAREGVKYTIRQEYGFGITEHDPALTPRHEAPASEGDAS